MLTGFLSTPSSTDFNQDRSTKSSRKLKSYRSGMELKVDEEYAVTGG
jgi:hypothetical protein